MLGKSLLSFSGKYRTHCLTAERWSDDTASGFRCLNVEQNNRNQDFWSSRHWFLGFFPSVYRYWVSGAVINSCIQQYSLKIHHLLRHLTADCFFKDNKNLCVRHQQLKSDPKLLPTLTPGQEETERTAPWTTRPSGTFRNTMSGEQSIHKKGRFSMMNPADHDDWSGVMSAGVTSLLAGVFLFSNAREFGHEIKGGNDLDKEEWKLSTEQKKKKTFLQANTLDCFGRHIKLDGRTAVVLGCSKESISIRYELLKHHR